MTDAVIQPSLVAPRAEVPLTPLEAALTTIENLEDDPFVARHAYLNPKRRRKPPSGTPAPMLDLPTPPPPPIIEAVAVPAAEPVAADAPRIRVIPRSTHVAPAKHQKVEAVTEGQSDSYRILIHIAIGVLAAVILIAIPLVGVMVYRSLHPHYDYQDFQPAADPSSDTTVASPNGSDVSSQPESIPAADARPAVNASAGEPATPTRVPKAKRRPAKRNAPPPVAVWPPPPSK
jgi:hypothetical protein